MAFAADQQIFPLTFPPTPPALLFVLLLVLLVLLVLVEGVVIVTGGTPVLVLLGGGQMPNAFTTHATIPITAPPAIMGAIAVEATTPTVTTTMLVNTPAIAPKTPQNPNIVCI